MDDEEAICDLLCRLMKREGFDPLTAQDGLAALRQIRQAAPDVLMVDLKLPDINGLEVLRRAKALDEDLPVIIITAYGDVPTAVEAIKAQAVDYISKPFEHKQIIQIVHQALKERERRLASRHPSCQILPKSDLTELMGPSQAVGRLIADASRVAKSNFSVVITGETGVGKELVARAIHRASPRARKPFIPVDCGAIPESLLESELFGHEKGAFTSADHLQSGKFEAAQGGTLFLDEISNLPLGSQAKLLRVLQEKMVYRVGGSKPVQVDVRLLAASNEDLESAVRAGNFRRDLFFRLNEFSVRIPPLRERSEDILYLAKRFMEITNQELNKQVRGFSEEAAAALRSYTWPGNVRQLRSTIRRAVLLAEDWIREDQLDIQQATGIPEPTIPTVAKYSPSPDKSMSLKEIVQQNTFVVEQNTLRQVLRETGGNKAKAARLLQIDYKTIQSKLKKYGIYTNPMECYGKEARA
ncbi:MAG: sigma-54 dependent transcriptional regulator [Candidatus Omnitrophica bacterium]|nr:sigma-54 dependent transcriptional regulator [Candidatus Omnitrophota bacterium]